MWQIIRQRFPCRPCSAVQLCLYGLTLVVCFFFFQQRDLAHTVGSSFAMLDGHFLDFYDVNQAKFFRDEYLPLIYGIFALWNIPVKILGLVSDPAALPFGVLVWSKVLLLLAFGGTALAVDRAARIIAGDTPVGRQPMLFFATAPIALFTVCMFGQYDIIGMAFSMWGFVFYLERRLTAFAWCFALAASFKYFPLIIFFPLLLLAEKNIWKLAKYTAIAVSVVAVQIGVWSLDPVFREAFFLQPLHKMDEAGQFRATPWLLGAYALGCLVAYGLKRTSKTRLLHGGAVFFPLYAYAVFFLTVIWHPQWIIVIVPFFALACLFVDARWMVALDWIGMLAFIWIAVHFWNGNCDVTMLQRGVLRDVCQTFPLSNNDLMPTGALMAFRYVFHLYVFAPLLLLGVSLLRTKKPEPVSGCLPYTIHYAALVVIFLLPSFFCAFAPISLAARINPQAVVATLQPGVMLDTDLMTLSPEILPGMTVRQSFVAEADNLAAIGVKIVNHKRRVTSHLRFTVQDAAGNVVTSEAVSGLAMHNNGYYAVMFAPVADSRGKTYSLTLDSQDAKHGNAVVVCISTGNLYPEGTSSLNGIVAKKAVLFRLYYAEQGKDSDPGARPKLTIRRETP